MQVTSVLRYARISPQKCRLVADVVRGKPVGNAIKVVAKKCSVSELKDLLTFAGNIGPGVDEAVNREPPCAIIASREYGESGAPGNFVERR